MSDLERERRGSAKRRSRLRVLLYLICALVDFSAMGVVFVVPRALAEAGAESWILGMLGAGMAFFAGLGYLLGGYLAHRFDGRAVFVAGALIMVISICLCSLSDPARFQFLPFYWLQGVGLGFLYPPLIGWINQGEDAHANRRDVSRRFIIYCISWNLGIMCSQWTAGILFDRGSQWVYRIALAAALLNLLLACIAARMVGHPEGKVIDPAESPAAAVELAGVFKRLSWIANLGGMFGGSMVMHLLSDLVVAIGISASIHGTLLAIWRAEIIATYLLMHVSTFWHYRISTALASQLVAAIGLVVIACSNSEGMLLLGLTLLGQLVGYNYFSGLYYSAAGSSHERRALAAGIHEATLCTGMAAGTFLGGSLGTLLHNPRAPYLLAAAVLIVLIAVQFRAWRRWLPRQGK
jgi:MFS family permease